MDAGVRPAREPNLTLLVRRRSMVQSSVLQRSSRDWGFGNERAGQRRAVGRRGGSSPRWSGLRQRRAARWYESRLPCHSARERLSPTALPPPPERAFDLPAFLPAKPELSNKKAGYFTTVDGMNRFALVAVDPERPQEIIGVVSFDREGTTERAEYAAEVADRWQGRGLGMALTRRLIGAALKRGVRTFIGIVLPENTRMLHLFRDLGLPERSRYEDGTDYVEIDLSPPQNASELTEGTRGPRG